ncbi:PBP1A family penicillin-binding protein [Alkalihalobacillus sp. LMS39]|uniref:transglycosylase domain-containing protein n=1 Tax=Alkalihalobacillus sp. LMS39 TaxID=2924032 RepID=UPI001FB44018|nr:PBP1A family penicillin-binding protein [Alkalihalobacillus sp. LMS39]UOE96364.1 PBP1A family penicillin-binding protein [Alkalihalobacillus sp. LMS39]
MKKKLLVGTTILAGMFFSLTLYLTILFSGDYVIDDKMLVMNSTTKIVSEDGEELAKLFIENREVASIHDIPEHVQDAFVAIEDARFYEHQGIDFRAIGRALYRDILAGAKVEGGSTITQQLAKNTFLTHDKTWLRKTKEVIIAMNLERRYSKDELLEMYLNRIYFGHGAYGIQAAATLYFNKDVSELTVEEGALLAGLPKAPNNLSPINDIEKSQQRRDVVLNVMHNRGYLSAEEVVRLQGKTVALNVNRINENEAFLTYIDMVLDEAEQRYHLSNEEVFSGGYSIIVPMDKQLQEASFELIRQNQFFPNGNEDAQSAVVMMDVDSGGILAVQGGRDYVAKGLNRVHAKRQPGSAFKPLAVYGPALEEQLNPYSILKDELIDYDGYTPRNANREYEGEVTMYDAVTHSLNAPTVWLLNELGVKHSHSYLEQLGVGIKDDGLAVALGGLTEGVSPLQLTKAYRAFAKEGKVVDPYFIEEIYDANGELVGRAVHEETPVFSKQTAWYMTKMLESVVTSGTGQNGSTSQAVAGKTGTTTYDEVDGGIRDAWFVGYTENVVGAVWMGYDATTPTTYLRGGSSYPTALFKNVIDSVDDTRKSYTFSMPDGLQDLDDPIHFVSIDDLEGALTFRGSGFVGVQLQWTPSSDDRLQYHVYEVTKEETELVTTVTGVGEVTIGSINPFSIPDYIVVPYNPQTEREGDPSNQITISWRKFGF